MPPALKRLRACPRKAPKMSDKQPELCQVGDRESGRLCRLPSSRLPSWGAAASTLSPGNWGPRADQRFCTGQLLACGSGSLLRGGRGQGGCGAAVRGWSGGWAVPVCPLLGSGLSTPPPCRGRAWLAGGGARGRQRPGVHTLPTSSRGGSGRLTDQRRTLEEISDRRRKKTQGGCTL